MKSVLMILMVLMSIPAVVLAGIDSDDISAAFNRLSESERASIAVQIATMVENKSSITTSREFTPDNIQQWVELGSGFGAAIAEAASKLGIAADAFLNSFTGKLIAVLIVWKAMGINMFGIFFIFISVPIWWMVVHKFYMVPVLYPVKAVNKGEKGKGENAIVQKVFTSDGSALLAGLALVVCVALGVLMVTV